MKQLLAKDNVTFLLDSVPVELLGEPLVSGLKVRAGDCRTKKVRQLAAAAADGAAAALAAVEYTNHRQTP